MKRLILTGLVALTAAITLTAQDLNFRLRWGATFVGATSLPIVTISGPTLSDSTTVLGTSIDLSGMAESTSNSPIVSVTWSCPTCTETSGTMTAASGGVVPWNSATGAGGITVFYDRYTGSTNTALSLLSATDIGGQWSELVNTAPAGYFIDRRAGGWAQLNSSTGNGVRVTMIGSPVPAISGTNYDIINTFQAVESADGDDGLAIHIFGSQDNANFCAVLAYGAIANPDFYLLKWSTALGLQTLASANIDPVTGNVAKTEVRGSNISVKVNDVERLSSTGIACNAGSGIGWGIGSFRNVSTDDASSRWHVDETKAVDQDISAGVISFPAGTQNTITVQACDGLGICGYDFINVTSQAVDDVAPEVIIQQPSATGSYPTSNATLPAITGTATDNVAVVSCSIASVTTTPTSEICTLTGTGTSKTFSCAAGLVVGSPTNTLTLTCLDAAGTPDTATLSVPYTAGDSTPPVVVITTDGGSGVGANFTTTTGTGTITGTCSDAVGCTQILPSCNVCTINSLQGGLGTFGQWTFTGVWAVGPNIVSVGAQDQAANVMSPKDTITVTYNPGVLTLSPKTFANGRVGVAYQPSGILATGGTGPYTYTNDAAGTSLNDADAQCAGYVVSSAGVVTGTPSVSGDCSWTGKATDSAAATDTQTYTITTVAAGAEGPHDYFNSLMARPDCFKAFSMRPDAAQTAQYSIAVNTPDCTHAYYSRQLSGNNGSTLALRTTYGYAADTHPEKQDGVKITVPIFIDQTANGYVLTGNIDATQEDIPMARGAGESNRGFRVDNEVMVVKTGATYNTVTGTWKVTRGLNTTPTSHTSGTATMWSINGNDTPAQARFPILTDGRITATYIVTWDDYRTTTFMNTGLTNHKTFQIAFMAGGKQGFEVDTAYPGPGTSNPNPEWAANGGASTYVGAMQARCYGQSTAAGFVQQGPPCMPANAPFLMKPNKWTRYWILYETNAETDSSKFAALSGGRATLNAAITDTTSTTFTMNHSGITTNPFTVAPYEWAGSDGNGSWKGRALRIGSEIMTIVSGTPNDAPTRTITVVRGEFGSTPTTHPSGAQIEVIDDFVTMYVADEDREPYLAIDRAPWHIFLHSSNPSSPGSLNYFWNEFNTSQSNLTTGRANGPDKLPGTADDFSDLVAYARNLIVIKNFSGLVIGDHSSWASIRTKPVK